MEDMYSSDGGGPMSDTEASNNAYLFNEVPIYLLLIVCVTCRNIIILYLSLIMECFNEIDPNFRA